MEMHPWIWFGLAGIFVISEIMTLALYFASFALAALFAGIVDALGANVAVQWIVLIAVGLFSLAVLRPIASKVIFRKTPKPSTGIDALIGHQAIVVEKVGAEGGRIRLKNEIWSARSSHGDIDVGSAVVVKAIDGAVAVVRSSESS
jgi:membrane protein implicated in regulation of membrane protease activity